MIADVIRALIDCVESLEWVERNYPGLNGNGVRQERIMAANALLTKLREAGEQQVVSLPASSRVIQALVGAGCETVADVVAMPWYELIRQPNFGHKSVRELQILMVKMGHSLNGLERGKREYGIPPREEIERQIADGILP